MRTFKLVLLGEGGVGKSSVVLQFIKKIFHRDSYDPTIEDSYVHETRVDGEPCVLDGNGSTKTRARARARRPRVDEFFSRHTPLAGHVFNGDESVSGVFPRIASPVVVEIRARSKTPKSRE